MRSTELARRIRRHVVEMAHISRCSHIGPAMSVADIVAVLYSGVMNVSRDDPAMPCRDRFILSKGHAGMAVYAALAESGFFPVEELQTYYGNGSRLSGHVSHKNVPGVELSTGSLGHGICVGAGMAMAAKLDGKPHRVFVVIGDGECNEGSVWEAALFCNHNRLSNLCVIVDHNKLQSLGTCEETMELLDLGAKWRAFGWDVREADGHDHDALFEVLRRPADPQKTTPQDTMGKPVCIIAHTVKGKGVSFMENQILWHYRDPQGEFYEQAVRELEEAGV